MLHLPFVAPFTHEKPIQRISRHLEMCTWHCTLETEVHRVDWALGTGLWVPDLKYSNRKYPPEASAGNWFFTKTSSAEILAARFGFARECFVYQEKNLGSRRGRRQPQLGQETDGPWPAQFLRNITKRLGVAMLLGQLINSCFTPAQGNAS